MGTQIGYGQTAEYYATIKMNKVMMHSTAQVNLTNSMPNKRKLTAKIRSVPCVSIYVKFKNTQTGALGWLGPLSIQLQFST